MTKTYFLCIAIIFLTEYNLYSQRDSTIKFGEEKEEVEFYFGFNLVENSFGAMYHLVIIKPSDNGKRKVRQLTLNAFIAQASGKQQSLANPNKIDFFEKYDIKNPNIIDDLWRLRYKEYPYYTNQKMEPGWSANDSIPFLPTPAQMETLKKFGLNRMSDFIFGENAFKLLKLMEQPEWVNSYKEKY